MDRVKHGVCRICGCTDTTPCYTHKEGACWWIDETHTLCSHCFYGFCEPQIEDTNGRKEEKTCQLEEL